LIEKEPDTGRVQKLYADSVLNCRCKSCHSSNNL